VEDRDRARLRAAAPPVRRFHRDSFTQNHFHYASLVSITRTLAYSVNSLVRVSRRLVKDRVPHNEGCECASVRRAVLPRRAQADSIYLPTPKEPSRRKDARMPVTYPVWRRRAVPCRCTHCLPCMAYYETGTEPSPHTKAWKATPSSQAGETATDPLGLSAEGFLNHGSYTLGAQRCQRLFHSLSKVLFIFRSHYLFAIGLGAIFSLRRSTPPILYSTLKLHDSWSPSTSLRHPAARLDCSLETGR